MNFNIEQFQEAIETVAEQRENLGAMISQTRNILLCIADEGLSEEDLNRVLSDAEKKMEKLQTDMGKVRLAMDNLNTLAQLKGSRIDWNNRTYQRFC